MDEAEEVDSAAWLWQDYKIQLRDFLKNGNLPHTHMALTREAMVEILEDTLAWARENG